MKLSAHEAESAAAAAASSILDLHIGCFVAAVENKPRLPLLYLCRDSSKVATFIIEAGGIRSGTGLWCCGEDTFSGFE
jgi:hypothetical protein